MTEQNLTLLCDFYEFTMSAGYFKNGLADKITYFDVFFRKIPDGGGFAICAGLEQIIEYIENFRFEKSDIEYLRSKGLFEEDFLSYLSSLRFTGDIFAVPEGTPVFPGEPILTVRAPAIQAQLIETYLLLELNHQSLIATKANRIVRAADGRVVLEFGSRRAQGASAAVIGARAAYIGGCHGTACALSDKLYGVPAEEQWRTPGCRCLTLNMRRLRRTVKCIRMPQRFLWIPTTLFQAVSLTPSRLLKMCCCLWE